MAVCFSIGLLLILHSVTPSSCNNVLVRSAPLLRANNIFYVEHYHAASNNRETTNSDESDSDSSTLEQQSFLERMLQRVNLNDKGNHFDKTKKSSVSEFNVTATSRKRNTLSHLLQTLTAEIEKENQEQMGEEDHKFQQMEMQADQSDSRPSSADERAGRFDLEGIFRRSSFPMSAGDFLKALNLHKASQTLLLNISASATTVAPQKTLTTTITIPRSISTSLETGTLSTLSPSNPTTTVKTVNAPSSSTQQTFTTVSATIPTTTAVVAQTSNSSYNCCNSSSLNVANADVIASRNELRKIRTDVVRLTADVRELRNRTAYLLLANQINHNTNVKSADDYKVYDDALIALNLDLNLTRTSLDAKIRAVEEKLNVFIRDFEVKNISHDVKFEQRVTDVEQRLIQALAQLKNEVNATLRQASQAFLTNITNIQATPKDTTIKPKGKLDENNI